MEKRTYLELTIETEDPSVEIWLADEEGHFVQKGVGILETSLLAGKYVVELGLGGDCFPIRLRRDLRLTEAELREGPTCQRPVPFSSTPDDA